MMSKDIFKEYSKSLGIKSEAERPKSNIIVDHDGFHNIISSHESITGYATTESSIGILYPNTLECDEDGLTLRSPNGEHSIRITNEGITLTGTLRSETRE